MHLAIRRPRKDPPLDCANNVDIMLELRQKGSLSISELPEEETAADAANNHVVAVRAPGYGPDGHANEHPEQRIRKFPLVLSAEDVERPPEISHSQHLCRFIEDDAAVCDAEDRLRDRCFGCF
jgi:hypothetical protein